MSVLLMQNINIHAYVCENFKRIILKHVRANIYKIYFTKRLFLHRIILIILINLILIILIKVMMKLLVI